MSKDIKEFENLEEILYKKLRDEAEGYGETQGNDGHSDMRALYRDVVEGSAIGVFIADRANRNTIYSNEALAEVCGLKYESIINRSVHDFLPESGKSTILTDEEVAALKFGEYWETHSERNGRYFTIKAKALMWHGVDSYILYITDETTEHEHQVQLQKLINEVPAGIGIFDISGENINLTYLNDAYYEMIGIGRGEREQYFGFKALTAVHEEDREKVLESTGRLLAGGTKESVLIRICNAQNVWIWMNLKFSVIDRKDNFVRIYASFTDCDDMVRAHEVAVREQNHYRMILDMTGTAYFEWDAANGFYASEKYGQYAMSDGGYGALMGNAYGVSCIYPEDMPVLRFYMGDITNNIMGKSVTIRLKMKDGHYQWTEIVAYAEKDENGNFVRIVGVLRDVDKEWIARNKRLQEALNDAERANRAKTAFLSRVSHDMRTPLNGILGLTAFLKESVTDEQAAGDVAQLEVSGQYLLNLINDTLDVSRIENGKLELHPTVCSGTVIFDNVMKLAMPNISSKDITFNVDMGKHSDAMLYMDVGRVEQIIMNILGNAVKFTPENGTIDFSAENVAEDDEVITERVSISDNGIGMSSDFLPTIFDAFSQADDTKTNSRQGTGLGMAITKQLIDLMGGEITVESELGRGSRFTFTIPMKKADETQINEWKKSRIVELDDAVLKGKKVLLCEDHQLNAQIATRLLCKKDMIVECAENGRIGLEMFEKSPPGYYDVVLMDVRMPVMDGIDAARRIRALSREDSRTVPIIAMTGNSFEEDMQQTKDAGMDAHLNKPIDVNMLFATLAEQLSTEHHFRRKKVLVADDIEVNRAVIKAAIEADYVVTEASDGAEALRLLEGLPDTDAVITDIMMPVMDGVELIKNLRSDPRYDHIKIIANTQYENLTQENELSQLGANAFLYKPNTPENIIRQLRNVLQG